MLHGSFIRKISKLLSAILLIVVPLACAGYKDKRNVHSPREIELGKMALDLSSHVNHFVESAPSDLSPSLTELNEWALRFNNAAQRLGADSLESRSAFDRLRYHASQLDVKITKEAYPALFESWLAIHGEIRNLSIRLGYKPDHALS